MVAKENASPLLLKVADVTVQRGGVKLLDSLNLEIPQGQNVAIVGPNGAGKTSLLRLLLRQLYPSITDKPPGRVEVLGSDIWNVWDMRRGMGVVSPELDRAFPTAAAVPITVSEAVITGFFGSQLPPSENRVTAQMWEAAREAIVRVGMAGFETRTLETLSTGELRRALIARALVHRPHTLILDEPTTGLDIAARAELLALLREFAKQGISLLLVTHHLEEIIPEIERVVLLARGRVHADGSKPQVLTSEKFSNLFGMELRVTVDPYGFYQIVHHTRDGGSSKEGLRLT